MGSSSLGDMVVSFGADLSNLSSGIAEAKSQIGSVSETTQSSSGGFMSGVSKMVGGAMNFASNVGLAVFGAKQMAGVVGGLGDALLGPAAHAEQVSVAFTTLMHSSSAASAELQRLNTFAAQTPFKTDDIDASAEKLLGFGFNAKAVQPDLTAIGDTLSSLGKTTPADLNGIVDIFGKIQAQGKMTGMDIMQLGANGIDATTLLEKGLGLSATQFQALQKKGIDAKMAIAGLTKGMEETFGGGMAKQAQTFNGQLSTLQSNVTLAMAGFGGPLLKIAEDGLSKLGALVASPGFQQFAVTLGSGIATALTVIVNVIGGVISGFTNLANFFSQNQVAADALVAVLIGLGVAMLAANAQAIIAGTVAIPGLVVGFGAWAIGAGAAAIATLAAAAPFVVIGAIVAAVVVGIILAIQHWGQIMNWIGGVVGAIWGGIKTAWSDAVGFFQGIGKGIQDVFQGVGDFLKGIWNGIVGIFKSIINAVIGAINFVIGIIDAIHIHVPIVNWDIGFNIAKIPTLSAGGVIQPGGWAIAGDPGPYSELVYGGTSGATVFSHNQSMAMAGAGGSGGETHVHIYMDGQEITNKVMKRAVQQIRSFGGQKR